MARLTRAQQQERTRAAVLVAARREFADHGYTAARVDRIAEQAELTRGAVYSNFAGKRALYLAVLVDDVERERLASSPPAAAPSSAAEVLGAFARVWLERLPLTGESPGSGHLQLRSLAGVVDDGAGRAVLAELVRLEALLLALAVESATRESVRRTRVALLVLTLLAGEAGLAESAPGAGDPFDVVQACTRALDLGLPDDGEPQHLSHVARARVTDVAWRSPRGLVDEVAGRPVDLDVDGVLCVLGAGRLSAVSEAVRWARRRDTVTVVVVTDDPGEVGRLVRMRLVDHLRALARAVGPAGLPPVRIVLDDRSVADALELSPVDDRTECAVRLRGSTIVARAEGPGAGYAAATA